MPQRSTPFQAIVRLVREHLAQPGVTITESKFLRDAVLRIDREVDVVIEGEFDGEPVVVSIEVNERGRRAGLPWVQEMIRKHRNLPTNRLILLSKAGFTSPALQQVATEAGRVQDFPSVKRRGGAAGEQTISLNLSQTAVPRAPPALLTTVTPITNGR
jgi:hypothetical protein